MSFILRTLYEKVYLLTNKRPEEVALPFPPQGLTPMRFKEAVIPAKAGIQLWKWWLKVRFQTLAPGLRRGDDPYLNRIGVNPKKFC